MTISGRRDRLTWLAFASMVLLGGGNAVAIRFSNRELAPFWGAGLRFAIASLLLFGVVVVRGVGMPRGRALLGALVFGALNFAAAFGLGYWALVRVHAGRGQVILALVPLLTLLLAIAHRQERLNWSSVAGAVLALLGVGTIFSAATSQGGDTPAISLAALTAAAACFAEAAVLIKVFPPVHPASLNAVAMALGAAILLLISALAQERWAVPSQPLTWVALGFVSVIGSVIVFSLYLFILGRWPASTTSYAFVLYPVVAVILSAQLDREALSMTLLAGGVLVLSGVYIGALARSPSAS